MDHVLQLKSIIQKVQTVSAMDPYLGLETHKLLFSLQLDLRFRELAILCARSFQQLERELDEQADAIKPTNTIILEEIRTTTLDNFQILLDHLSNLDASAARAPHFKSGFDG